MKIGITEAGDASLDYSWINKAPGMDMMILITKNVTDKFIQEVMPFANKTIVHATCTGYGGTVMEPNVPKPEIQLEQVRKLIAWGFPADQVVIRIDPIVPTVKGCKLVEAIVSNIHNDVKRFRVSVIDNYAHIQKRFEDKDLPILFNGEFQASAEEFAMVDEALSRLKFRFPDITFESCAEPQLRKPEKIGCVNAKDLTKFGLKVPRQKGTQRNTCLCLAGKTEMLSRTRCYYCVKSDIWIASSNTPSILTNEHPGCEEGVCKTCENLHTYGCSNMCLYCYWRT